LKKKKIKGYVLSREQILFLKYLKKNKRYKNVLPSYKGMVTMSINKKKIINTKHLHGVKEAIKKVDVSLLKRFNSPTLNMLREIKNKVRPFQEIFVKNPLLSKQENHSVYLKSGTWKRKRNYILMKRKAKCERCGYSSKEYSQLHLHHKTYRRWGAERQNDLELLCLNCHNHLHNKYTIYELEELYNKNYNINL
jgi:hypothetical protein